MARDMSLEQFEAWAGQRLEDRAAARLVGEEGGPGRSQVPVPSSMASPLTPDFLDDEDGAPALRLVAPDATIAFTPEPSRKLRTGWSAARQRCFIEALAETGSVHHAARAAQLSARSAYRLRVRSPAFAAAWDAAQNLAVGRLSALAFDRAIHGRTVQLYRDGELIAEKREPNDRMLMWLLTRLDPARFAHPADRPATPAPDFAALTAALADHAITDDDGADAD